MQKSHNFSAEKKNRLVAQVQELFVILYSFIAFLIASVGMFFLVAVLADILPLGYLNPVALSIFDAVLYNFLLTLLFLVQHTVMARDSFKSWHRSIFGDRCIRSTYVLASGLVISLILLYWQPIQGQVWMAEGALKWLLWVGFAAGIAVVAGALFAIDFSHFFGIKQAFWGQGEEHTKQLHIRGLYKYSRHPIMLGVLITLWCVPSMSITKLNLSILMTIYMFIGLHFEEKALIKHFGDEYRRYQKQVGRIISFPWGKK